jgi:hypothetical protein
MQVRMTASDSLVLTPSFKSHHMHGYSIFLDPPPCCRSVDDYFAMKSPDSRRGRTRPEDIIELTTVDDTFAMAAPLLVFKSGFYPLKLTASVVTVSG